MGRDRGDHFPIFQERKKNASNFLSPLRRNKSARHLPNCRVIEGARVQILIQQMTTMLAAGFKNWSGSTGFAPEIARFVYG